MHTKKKEKLLSTGCTCKLNVGVSQQQNLKEGNGMEKFFTRKFGVVWIGMIIFLSFIIAERPSESGIAISFLIVSIGMTYFHFSGQFDPEKHRPRLPPSVAEVVFLYPTFHDNVYLFTYTHPNIPLSKITLIR